MGNIELSDRVLGLIHGHRNGENPIGETFSLLREILRPAPENYAMTYRYEHSLRVAMRGRQIAEGEGWEPEPLVIACLLHDIGYPECKTMEELLKYHPAYSAEIAGLFLKNINYDSGLAESICRAVELHDQIENLPTDASAFELSVRDADDLDRFDAMRVYMKGGSMIGENNAADIAEGCRLKLRQIEEAHGRVCGTGTAKRLWEEQLSMRKGYYEALLGQVEKTWEMEGVLEGILKGKND